MGHGTARVGLGFLLLVGACPSGDGTPPNAEVAWTASGVAWPEANVFGYREAAWLGGDASFSVELAPGRFLWIFGDSFIATSGANVRTESKLVRNSIAIGDARNPAVSGLDYIWGDDEGTPTAFFPPPQPEHWAWPGEGALLADGTLAIFLLDVHAVSGGLGFEVDGSYLVLIANPFDDPLAWQLETKALGETFDTSPGSAAMLEDGYLVAVATRHDADQNGYLVRYAESDLASGIVTGEWWSEGQWRAAETITAPTQVLPRAHTEGSLHFDSRLRQYIHITTEGSYGLGNALVRMSSSIAGPYRRAGTFTPPEQLEPDPRIYAFKGHPELDAGEANALLITYATSSFSFPDLFAAEGVDLYRPKFARIRFGPEHSRSVPAPDE